MSERDIQAAIQLAASADGHRLFRNSSGNGYVGNLVKVLPNGDAIIRNWRRISFGLADGAGDLIGLTRGDGRFTCVEVKGVGYRMKHKDQRLKQENFISMVQAAGGRAGFAESVEQARQIWSP